MLGKVAEVSLWEHGKGSVEFEGELWNATSDDDLNPGDKAIIQEVGGLLLKIASSELDGTRT
jgi:membrane protein implicated in regulation of membrane protease activity